MQIGDNNISMIQTTKSVKIRTMLFSYFRQEQVQKELERLKKRREEKEKGEEGNKGEKEKGEKSKGEKEKG